MNKKQNQYTERAQSTLTNELKRNIALSIAKMSAKTHTVFLYNHKDIDVFAEMKLQPDKSGAFPILRDNKPMWVSVSDINLASDAILISVGFEGYASERVGFRDNENVAGKSIVRRVFIPILMNWDNVKKTHIFNSVYTFGKTIPAYTYSTNNGFELTHARHFTNSSAVFNVSDIIALTVKKLKAFVSDTRAKIDMKELVRPNGNLTHYGAWLCRDVVKRENEKQIAKLISYFNDERINITDGSRKAALFLLTGIPENVTPIVLLLPANVA